MNLKEQIYKQVKHEDNSGESPMVDKAQVETALKVAAEVGKGIIDSKVLDANKDGKVTLADFSLLAKDGKSIWIIMTTIISIVLTAIFGAVQSGDYSLLLTIGQYVAGPLSLIFGFKKVIDKYDGEKEQMIVTIQDKDKRIKELETDNQFTANKYELELKQREGIIALKNWEIERQATEIIKLNADIAQYKGK